MHANEHGDTHASAQSRLCFPAELHRHSSMSARSFRKLYLGGLGSDWHQNWQTQPQEMLSGLACLKHAGIRELKVKRW